VTLARHLGIGDAQALYVSLDQLSKLSDGDTSRAAMRSSRVMASASFGGNFVMEDRVFSVVRICQVRKARICTADLAAT
jgi:hypothetical protein